MRDDEWVKVAMAEDAVAAELLLALKETKATAPIPTSTSAPERPALSFEWRVRQRRSKAAAVQTKKQTPPRASPSTPLSWSGATSTSGFGGLGAGGGGGGGASGGGVDVEESTSQLSPPPSAPKSSDIPRSKADGSSEVGTIKRCRKKKTLAELKEEELLLERERRQLKRQLASIRDNLEKERTRNENFKRMKQQQQQQQMASFNPISITLSPIAVTNLGLIRQSSPNSCPEAKMEATKSKFVLPDLNLPLEENPSTL